VNTDHARLGSDFWGTNVPRNADLVRESEPTKRRLRDSHHEPNGSNRRIRLNVLPFVLAPGVGAWGYVVGGSTGTMLAMGGWAATVATATLIVIAREARRRRHEGDLD